MPAKQHIDQLEELVQTIKDGKLREMILPQDPTILNKDNFLKKIEFAQKLQNAMHAYGNSLLSMERISESFPVFRYFPTTKTGMGSYSPIQNLNPFLSFFDDIKANRLVNLIIEESKYVDRRCLQEYALNLSTSIEKFRGYIIERMTEHASFKDVGTYDPFVQVCYGFPGIPRGIVMPNFEFEAKQDNFRLITYAARGLGAIEAAALKVLPNENSLGLINHK